MLTMSTASIQKFSIPTFSWLILGAGLIASLLAQVPAGHPASVPAGAQAIDITHVR